MLDVLKEIHALTIRKLLIECDEVDRAGSSARRSLHRLIPLTGY